MAGFSSSGEFKQALTRDYNRINSCIFACGVVTLKIDVYDDRISMLAVHKRQPALQTLSRENAHIADLADLYLIKAFKKEMRQTLVEQYGLDVLAIFKDYDASAQLSSTVVMLKNRI
ncbi:MAG TPA: DUF2294 domain-containing protein [Alcaligenes sp.]|nr:DUF2294 domain-containing protein [Alcaligenes sp.]